MKLVNEKIFNYALKAQQFIRDVLKFERECKNLYSSVIKPLIIILICLIYSTAVASASFFIGAKKEKPYPLPPAYYFNSVLADSMADVDKDGQDERLVILRDKPGSSFGTTRTLQIKKNGAFVELSEGGGDFRWWKIGDFNKNGKVDVVVHYGYTGSAGFGQLEVSEWSNGGFITLLSKNDVGNDAEFKDLDGDGIKEIIYDYAALKWEKHRQIIYKWDPRVSRLLLTGSKQPL